MRIARSGLIATIAVHALAAYAFLGHHPVRQKLAEVAPLTVHLISPPAPQRVQPPRPLTLPAPKLAVPSQPKIEISPAVSVRSEAPRPASEASRPAVASSASAASPAPPPIAEPQPISVPVTPPIFNADYLSNPAPEYPGSSRRLREEGRVILRVLVRKDGTAAQVEVRTSSGYARLDGAARDAVLHWKFIPAKRGNDPLEEWVLIPLSFRLQS